MQLPVPFLVIMTPDQRVVGVTASPPALTASIPERPLHTVTDHNRSI